MKFTYMLLLGLAHIGLAQDSIYVQQAIDLTNLDSLIVSVRQLAGELPVGADTIKTRASIDGRAATAEYLYQRLLGYGLDASKQPYTVYATGTNVVAVQHGTEFPDVQYILCAHYDSYPLAAPDTCPGAGDNASGAAIVLEAARILSKFSTKYTVIYAFWDQEEYGSYGSLNYAIQARLRGDSIAGVINVDQFAWDTNNDNLMDIHTRPIVNSESLADTIVYVNTKFQIGLAPAIHNPGGAEGDHSSFWTTGTSAVWVCEAYWGHESNLFRHTDRDSLKYFNLPYFYRGGKLVIGSIATLAGVGASGSTVTVSCKVLLQGAFSGGAMATALRDASLVPTSQPYFTVPWNYTGIESVTSIPVGVVDWVLLEVRAGTPSSTTMGKRAAFLKSDGIIVDLDGTSQVSFVGVTPGPYYVVVRHRNHLSVMSATVTPLGASSSTLFDFTAGTGQYFGGGAKDLGGGKFGMFAGNNDGDNVVTVLDYNAVGAGIFTTGYLLADHDMDGLITVLDYNVVGQNLFVMSNVP